MELETHLKGGRPFIRIRGFVKSGQRIVDGKVKKWKSMGCSWRSVGAPLGQATEMSHLRVTDPGILLNA